MAQIVLVRKRGTRKDGRNYVTTCTVCNGAARDVSGVGGVSKEAADAYKESHIRTVHYGKRSI